MKRVLMLSTVASLQDQFNMANIRMLRNLHCMCMWLVILYRAIILLRSELQYFKMNWLHWV